MGLKLPSHSSKQTSTEKLQSMFENAGSDNLSDLRTASFDYVGRGNSSFAIPHYFDPTLNNPMGNNQGRLNLYENEHQRKTLQEWMRVFYDTHPIVGSIIDMYSRYPMSGCEIIDKDKGVRQFFEELFLDSLDYETLLIDIGREYWMIGEVAAFGTWDESMGIWTNEDLLDTANIEVLRMPFSAETSYKLKVDDNMKSLVNGGTPEAMLFKNEQPELWKLISSGSDIPISEDNLFWACRASKRGALRGTPVLLRALRTLRLEERMSSAMQATAERMYSPMVLFKLGMKMDDGTPLMPTPQMIAQFKQNFNAALNSDFRAIFTHFMVDEKELFTNTRMNNWKQDWDMLDEKIYACFGMSSDMVKASNSQTYASTALRFDLISQFMRTHQRMLINFYNKRARKVAEAQGFWETDDNGEIVYETYLEVDEDGKEELVKREKPHWPELKMKVINFKDDKQQRDFLLELRRNDVPVCGEDLAVGVDIDLNSSAEKLKEEKIKDAVLEAKTQDAILNATAGQGLPIPPATKKFYMDGVMPKRYENWFNGEIVTVNDEGGGSDGNTSLMDGLQTDKLYNIPEEEIEKIRPSVSDEQREEMPKEGE